MSEIVIPVTIRDLTPGDLPSCAWSGPPAHLASVASALERARRGEAGYLAVCPPSGLPVALGGIDYAKIPGAGTLWHLAVHAALQSCGIGTILIQAAEQRICARGLYRAELGVEESNRGPARCMSSSATAASPPRGTRKPRTDPSPAPRRSAR